MTFRAKAPVIHNFPPLYLPDTITSELSHGLSIDVFNGGDQPVNRITLSFSQGTADIASPAAMHILSKLMKEGTKKHSAQEISETLDFNGAWLKANPSNHYFDITLHSINSRADKVIGFLKEIVYDPLLSENEFNHIKQRLAATADTQQRTVVSAARRESSRLFFGESHPFAKLPPKPEDYLAVTLNQVVELHQQLFVNIQPKISIAGQCEELIPLICDTFSDLGELKCSTSPTYIPANTSQPQIKRIDIEGATQSAINISIPSIPRSHNDYIDLRYGVIALGGYFGSRLMKQIREEQGLTYNITAQLLGHNEGTEMLITSQTDTSTTNLLIDSTMEVLKSMREYPITTEEISHMKAYSMSVLAATLDSPFSIMDYHTTIRRMDCGKDYFSKQQQRLEQLTPQRIAEVMNLHINPDNAIITIAGPETDCQ